MKKKIILLLFLVTNSYPTFYFQTHKTDRNFITGLLRLDFLAELKNTFGASIFIETGTLHGGTSINASKIFYKVYTTELHPTLYQEAVKNISHCPNIHAYNLHSGTFIEKIAGLIEDRSIFWLDAHYSGPQTAYSDEDHTQPSAITPIREELASIKNRYEDTIILIDDARCFGAKESNNIMQSYWGYPSIQEICNLINDINNNYDFLLIGDTLMAYDKKFNVEASPIVKACTVSRLYDGNNYSLEEILNAEKIITSAQASELQLIGILYSILQNIDSVQIYHYALWRGLACLNSNSAEAYQLFKEILIKYKYTHWRIKWYLAQATIALNKTQEAINYLEEIFEIIDYTPAREQYFKLIHN